MGVGKTHGGLLRCVRSETDVLDVFALLEAIATSHTTQDKRTVMGSQIARVAQIARRRGLHPMNRVCVHHETGDWTDWFCVILDAR